jgi:ethanolamine utilization protein EutN
VQPYQTDGTTPDGDPQLAVDRLGAACGDTVIITSDGKYVREILTSDTTPVRWSILGIQDLPIKDAVS